MNLLERVYTLLQVNLASMTEKSEDPERTLKRLQLDMHNQFMQVKTQVATSIAETMKLQRQQKEKLAEADIWIEKARSALREQKEKAAREFLSYYNDLIQQAQGNHHHQQAQEALVSTMRNALRQLEVKISEVDRTVDALIAHKHNALLQQRLHGALNALDKKHPLRTQKTLLETETHAHAMTELQPRELHSQIEASQELNIEQLRQSMDE